MNPNKPIVLVIASVLKPVDEVRMYKKFAKSLVRTGRYAVNIIGFRSRDLPHDQSVRFYPLFNFSRLHWGRLLANYRFYRVLKRLAPQILVLTTPELYPAAWWYRLRFGTLLVYDMVENYGRNIRYNRGFATWLITPLAALAERMQQGLFNASSLILLAEQGYCNEVALPNNVPQVVVENKGLDSAPTVRHLRPVHRPIAIVYTGTVSEVYGIKLALSLMKLLIEQENLSATFTILGHVPRAVLHRQLREYAQHHAWLRLRTSDAPVPHSQIISLVQQADFGVVSHQPIPSIAQCFPTRIWEYMTCQLPFLLQDHPYWTRYCRPWQCAVPLDFKRPIAGEVKQLMLETSFYPQGTPKGIYWNSEEKKLVSALKGIHY